MRTSRPILAVALLFLAAADVRAQSTSKVSCFQNFGYANVGAVSGDGRYVVYGGSDVLSLFPYTVFHHVYLADTSPGFHAQQLLTTSDGNVTDFTAWFPTISADGGSVVFTDPASHSGADSNSTLDVYVYDRVGASYELISANLGGLAGNADSSTPGSISADGRFVVFTSRASDLVSGDVNGKSDVFLRDRVTGTTELASISSTGLQGDADSFYGAVSDDGRFVAFASRSTNLVTGDVGGFCDVFLRDRLTGTTIRSSVDSSGNGGNADSASPSMSGPSISADGRIVAFQSAASNLVPNDTNGFQDVFVHDELAHFTRRVSLGSGNAQGNGKSSAPSISADGRYVGFVSGASNLVANDTNLRDDVFLRDRTASVTELESVTTSGQQQNFSAVGARISADGRFVVFDSYANNLDVLCGIYDPGDTNVFLHDRGPLSGPIAPFCAGDGSGTACPCGNDSAAGSQSGCLNSLGSAGSLGSTGNSSIGTDTLVLQGTGMNNSSCLYFQGATQVSAVFGDGLRCAGGATVRLGVTSNSGGASHYPFGAQPPVHVKGNVTAPATLAYQVWYRDAAAFCSGSTYNLTNGLSVTWIP